MTKSRDILRKRWKPTPAEIEFVRRQFPNTQTEILAKVLGVAYHQVSRLAKKLNVKKSEAFYLGPESGRLTGVTGSVHRFQKGFTPANKGVKQPGKVTATSFKPGRPAQEVHNYVPIGTEKVSSDGYLVRKVTDDRSIAPVRRWEGVHRIVWAESYGPIPKGYVVAFKPGMRTANRDEITLDRLELLTLAQNMARNTIHSYPPELADTMRLRGQITRAINKRTKEQTT